MKAVREMNRAKNGGASVPPSEDEDEAGSDLDEAAAAATVEETLRSSGRKRKAPANFDPLSGPASSWGQAVATPPVKPSASPKASPNLARQDYSCAACLDNKAIR